MSRRDSRKGLGRRHLFAASLGAAAALPLAACGSSGSPASDFRSPHVTDAPAARNVRDFGAVGDGNADDTAAIAAAAAVGDKPLVLYLPAGHYNVSRWPDMPDFATVLGDGGDVSLVLCTGDTTLINLHKRNRVRFSRLGFYLTGPKATAIQLDECFRCSFESVVIRGNHLSDNYPRFAQQRGIVLQGNTGGTSFIDCDINNFGFGLVTSCIQNYVTSSKFTSNYIGVLGTGNDHNAGLALTNVEFVSDEDPKTTDKHLLVDGAANDWWLTNVWFEGADTALSVGARDRGGPAQFGMVNCKVAARTLGLDLIYCRQPYLANVQFDRDLDHPPTELRIDSQGCPEGTAINLISSAADDIAPGVFPNEWHVLNRSGMHETRLTGTTIAMAGSGDADIFQARATDGSVRGAITSGGTWVSDRAENGIMLRDPKGGYWRITVGADGALKTSSLGAQRPRE
ncbi:MULTISPECIES: glycoside hydrolase family 55 protein [unclassified Nocardia]|uniref:glycoside hydrolase family 55 protein n=1 Tax=unclassified Nocardia TaxID=2637762 RepID=UPI001CE3EC21|nr:MULTISPECIES: glycoside hydrolase family 55 protein [unclassified Nocardia]